MQPEFVGALDIPREAGPFLERDADGVHLLPLLFELQTAVSRGMVRATILLGTASIEGLLRIQAKRQGVWDTKWEEDTFYQLVETRRPIRELLPPGLGDRVRGLADFRRPMAHFKASEPLVSEAQLASRTVADLLNEWCR